MRVVLEDARCEGHGMCEEACPEVFRLDAAGQLEILVEEIPDRLAPQVATAVRLCPVAALALSDDRIR